MPPDWRVNQRRTQMAALAGRAASGTKPELRPRPSSSAVSAAMSRQRVKDTAPEVKLRQALHRRGLRFRIHRQPIPGLRRTVDIVFPRERLAVDVRGCFWHACPIHGSIPRANREWWQAKLSRNTERDIETQRALGRAGWLLVVVWEHESSEAAAEQIETILRRSRTLDRG